MSCFVLQANSTCILICVPSCRRGFSHSTFGSRLAVSAGCILDQQDRLASSLPSHDYECALSIHGTHIERPWSSRGSVHLRPEVCRFDFSRASRRLNAKIIIILPTTTTIVLLGIILGLNRMRIIIRFLSSAGKSHKVQSRRPVIAAVEVCCKWPAT